MLEKFDDLFQLLLGLIYARHIVERRLGVGFDVDFRFAASDRHQPAEPPFILRDASEPEHPNPEKQQRRNNPREQRAQKCVLDLPTELHMALFEHIRELRRNARGHEALGAVGLRFFPLAFDVISGYSDLGNFIAVEVVDKLAVRNCRDVSGPRPTVARSTARRKWRRQNTTHAIATFCPSRSNPCFPGVRATIAASRRTTRRKRFVIRTDHNSPLWRPRHPCASRSPPAARLENLWPRRARASNFESHFGGAPKIGATDA